MADVKSAMREVVCKALNDFIEIKGGASVDEEKIVVQTTPNPEMGDLGVPVFVFAKTLHMAPPQISAEVVKIIKEKYSDYAKNCGEFTAVGPYVNLKLNKAEQSGAILKKIFDQGEKYGSLNENGKPFLGGRKVMIEFSAPNTNKPLHLGHLRNDALGESVSRILKAAGAEVCKVNLVNNRGVHICKSMLAYKWFHEEKGETPESLGIKGDHFVGQCYVEFDRWLKGEKDKPETAHPEALAQARFHAAAKLVGILLFHLPPQPCKIAAREAVRLVAQRLQSFRRVKAELSARADQHQPAAVIFRRVYAQALRIDVLRAGDRPVIQALCAAHIDQPVASLLPFFQFLHADFHVAFPRFVGFHCFCTHFIRAVRVCQRRKRRVSFRRLQQKRLKENPSGALHILS